MSSSPAFQALMNAAVISCASWPGVVPVGMKPVVCAVLLGRTTKTTVAAIAATTAMIPAMMAVRRLRDPPDLARWPRRDEGGPPDPLSPSKPGGRSEPTAWNGAVGGSDAYQGPDDLLPFPSPVTHAKVPSGPGQDKYACWEPAPLSPSGGWPLYGRSRQKDGWPR